jgi:WD40 repeat protein
MSATTWQERARVIHEEDIRGVRFSGDSRFLATWGWNRPDSAESVARLVSTETGQEVASVRHSSRAVGLSVSFSPDGKFLATVSDAASLVATVNGREVARLVPARTGV